MEIPPWLCFSRLSRSDQEERGTRIDAWTHTPCGVSTGFVLNPPSRRPSACGSLRGPPLGVHLGPATAAGPLSADGPDAVGQRALGPPHRTQGSAGDSVAAGDRCATLAAGAG